MIHLYGSLRRTLLCTWIIFCLLWLGFENTTLCASEPGTLVAIYDNSKNYTVVWGLNCFIGMLLYSGALYMPLPVGFVIIPGLFVSFFLSKTFDIALYGNLLMQNFPLIEHIEHGITYYIPQCYYEQIIINPGLLLEHSNSSLEVFRSPTTLLNWFNEWAEIMKPWYTTIKEEGKILVYKK